MGKLTDAMIQAIEKDGLVADGGGIFLRRRAGNFLWMKKWVREGKVTWASLGSYPGTSIEEAREKGAGMDLLMAQDEDPFAAIRSTQVVPKVLNPADIAWIRPQMMTIHHFTDRFAVPFHFVLKLIQQQKIFAVKVVNSWLITCESAWAWYNSLPRVQPEELKVDFDKLTDDDMAVLTQMAERLWDQDQKPTQRLINWGVLMDQDASALATKFLSAAANGITVEVKEVEVSRTIGGRRVIEGETERPAIAVPKPTTPARKIKAAKALQPKAKESRQPRKTARSR
jgi:hypothetical protein